MISFTIWDNFFPQFEKSSLAFEGKQTLAVIGYEKEAAGMGERVPNFHVDNNFHNFDRFERSKIGERQTNY